MKIGRNEPCPCGSGKKYKKCCLNIDEQNSYITSKIENTNTSAYTKKDMDKKDLNLNLNLAQILNNLQNFMLKDKPHIKEYKKIRNLHSEIVDSMINYYYNGKFEFEVSKEDMEEIEDKILGLDVDSMCTKFDTETDLGVQSLANIMFYKNGKNIPCITEKYIKENRYRKPEKIELLNCMLNSKASLFETIRTEREQGYVYLKDVFSGEEYCVTDIARSANSHNDQYYIYSRIITYNGISFGTGLGLPFKNKDKFINDWISKNKKEYDKKQELVRFLELYNEYRRDSKGIKMSVKNF